MNNQSMLEKTKKELDDVKRSIKRAKDEAKCLRVAIALVSGSRHARGHGRTPARG